MEATNMKKNAWFGLLALVLAAAVLFGVWYTSRPATQPGDKTITVGVIHADASQKTFTLSTNEEYLAEALVEGEVVENNQESFGLYILTADGETANEGNQEWWCITKGGERMNTGASETPIADGDAYELTFTVGYGS